MQKQERGMKLTFQVLLVGIWLSPGMALSALGKHQHEDGDPVLLFQMRVNRKRHCLPEWSRLSHGGE